MSDYSWVSLGEVVASVVAKLANTTNTETSFRANKYSVPTNQGASSESEMPMNVNTIYPGRWLKAASLQGKPAILEIASATIEELQSPDGKQQRRLVLRFTGEPQALVVNKTNLNVLAEFLGDETDDWVGKAIEVYPDRTSLGGKTVACVRVRPPR